MADWTTTDYRGRTRAFIEALKDKRDFEEAAALLRILDERGASLREPRSKALGNGLFELRGKQIRIFYVFRPGHRIVLLGGIVKKRGDIKPRILESLRLLQSQIE